MKTEKYKDIDKNMSKYVKKEFDGKIVESTCPHCKGKGFFASPIKKTSTCQDCNGVGFINYQY